MKRAGNNYSHYLYKISDYMLKQALSKNVRHFGCEKLELLSFVYFFGEHPVRLYSHKMWPIHDQTMAGEKGGIAHLGQQVVALCVKSGTFWL